MSIIHCELVYCLYLCIMYNSLLFLFEKGYIMQPLYVAICSMNQAFTKDKFDQFETDIFATKIP